MSANHKISRREAGNRDKARLSTLALLFLWVAIFIFPFFTYPDPPPEQEGVLVNLEFSEQGQGEENAPPTIAEEEPQPVEPEPTPVEPEPEPTPVKEEVKPQPAEEKKVVTTEDPDAIALKKRKEEETKKREEETKRKVAEEAARKKAQAEADAKKKAAEEEARRKAAEDAERKRREAEANKTKDQIGGLFNNSGSGKGKTGTTGNQGDPNGDPNASKLEGISKGVGQVGGGLAGRGGSGPQLQDSSQKVGSVVVRVCVDENGKVVSADFTQAGSSGSAASDASIQRMAVENAKSWKFAKGAEDKQCGTITYRFTLR